jgi:cytochrome bd-type quinol oxidase subunit 1
MIQRIQSIYLLVAAFVALSTWLFPIASFTMPDGVHVLRTTGLFDPQGVEDAVRQPMLPFNWLHTLVAAILVGAIFLFGQRPRQARVVRLAYVLALWLLAFQYITRNSTLAYLAQRGPVEGNYGWVFVAPMLVIILAFLAERAIKSDEALVRNMDRLR